MSACFLFFYWFSSKKRSSRLLRDFCRSIHSFRFQVSRSNLSFQQTQISSLRLYSIFLSQTQYRSMVFYIYICCFYVNFCRMSIFSVYISRSFISELSSKRLLSFSLIFLYFLSASFFSEASYLIFFLQSLISLWMLLKIYYLSFNIKVVAPFFILYNYKLSLSFFSYFIYHSRRQTLSSETSQALCQMLWLSASKVDTCIDLERVYVMFWWSFSLSILFQCQRWEMQLFSSEQCQSREMFSSSVMVDQLQVNRMPSAVYFLESISELQCLLKPSFYSSPSMYEQQVLKNSISSFSLQLILFSFQFFILALSQRLVSLLFCWEYSLKVLTRTYICFQILSFRQTKPSVFQGEFRSLQNYYWIFFNIYNQALFIIAIQNILEANIADNKTNKKYKFISTFIRPNISQAEICVKYHEIQVFQQGKQCYRRVGLKCCDR